MRRGAAWLGGLGMLAAAAAAHATILVPMRDEDLVAISDLVLVGTVERIESVLLGTDRVMTRVTIGVEDTLKGEPGAPSVVVTEPGGEVAGIRGVVFGTPSFTDGERVLVFLRARADGTLATTALALGKYAILPARDGTAMARREAPTVDARPLGMLADRVRALATGGAHADGRAGAGIEPPTFSWTQGAFNLSTNDQGIAGRWFEPDCGLPILYDRAGADPAFDDAASASALAAATAAWTGVPSASIVLMPNAVVAPTASGVGGTLDGHNTVMFGDPFSDVPDLVNCTGVLAIGGIFSAFSTQIPELNRVVNGRSFGKGFEGDVVLNPEVGMCLGDSVPNLAEVVTHEIGHTLGFGHSSEDPNETDPLKSQAIMYFAAHGDDRGAALGADDVAAASFSYPTSLVAPTPLAALACEVNLGILNVACTGQLAIAPFRKIAKAGQTADKAAAATSRGKQKRLLKKTLALLAATDRAITRFIHGPCASGMHEHVRTYRQHAKSTLASI